MAKEGVEEARGHIAQMINAKPSEILFLSGGNTMDASISRRIGIDQPGLDWWSACASQQSKNDHCLVL